jgi:hypothetical protein
MITAMADCFCGCERSIGLIGHKRRANKLGEEISAALGQARGALARVGQLQGDPELEQLAGSGQAILDELAAYLHDELARDELDEAAASAWDQRFQRRRGDIADAVMNEGWTGLDPTKVAPLVLAGARAPATIVGLHDSGAAINRRPNIDMRLRVEPPGAESFDIQQKFLVSRLVDVPRQGARVEVAYDPADTTQISLRPDDAVAAAPASAQPGDPVAGLAQLTELHAGGALSDEEFRAAKARLLGLG